MNLLHYILLLYPVINFLEAWLEVVVIALKDPDLSNYKTLNDREHFRSAGYAIAVCMLPLLCALTLQYYWLIPAILFNRRLVFDYSLKHLRNKQFDLYEGDGFFDTIGRWFFGREGAEKEFLILIIITIISIVKTCL